ncbi:hydroxymethylbilane synthase [Corynebacterium mayonis]|uniref:hydroxymethylbilane synthase n=1 Tax=Corynebacterium mayonis TaxID=3062461 RepID=UPI0031402CC5
MLKIGTRGSNLAMTQAGHMRDAIMATGAEAELKIVKTAGDKSMAPVERIGVGVFTTALRDALFDATVDVAVHSFKDLPTAPDERAHLIVPKRENNREALIARDGLTLTQLPKGARVGTSAPRRVSQLRALRPDLDIRPLRGNIETRMSYVTDGELDAVVLAYAGLSRAGYSAHATEVFDPEVFMPAPAQGALAVECRADDETTRATIDHLVDHEASICAAAERQILATLQAGCTAPVASYATLDEGVITLRGGVFATDGSAQLVEEASGTDPVEVGRAVARQLFERGAARYMN